MLCTRRSGLWRHRAWDARYGLKGLSTRHFAPDKHSYPEAKDAYAVGAGDVVAWHPAATDPIPLVEHMANRFDFLLSTIPFPFDISPFLSLLRQNGIFVNVGAPGAIAGVSGGALWNQRRSIAGSCIGDMPETQEVVDYCYTNAIRPQIELIRPDQIDEAYLRDKRKDVRYHFVIDLASHRTG